MHNEFFPSKSRGRCSIRDINPYGAGWGVRSEKMVIWDNFGAERSGCAGAYRKGLKSLAMGVDALLVVRDDVCKYRSLCNGACNA